MEYFLILLAAVGLNHIILYGSILNPFRKIVKKVKLGRELLDCVLCLGFWCSFFVASTAYLIKPNIFYIFIPFAGSAVCLVYEYIIDILDNIWIILKEKNKKIN